MRASLCKQNILNKKDENEKTKQINQEENNEILKPHYDIQAKS